MKKELWNKILKENKLNEDTDSVEFILFPKIEVMLFYRIIMK